MRFRLTAKIDADAKSVGPFSVAVGDLRVGVTIDESRSVREIWVELPVRDYETFLPRVTRPPGEMTSVDFREPPEADQLLEALQYVESLGSIWLSINRIHWGEAKHEWIPESAEENSLLPVFSMTWEQNYQRTPIEFRGDLLHDIFVHQSTKEWLTIPLSFFREGRNDYVGHRYINAFFNFYFLLEDLFGEGKTKNPHVLQMFLSSDELKQAAAAAYRDCDMAGQDVRPRLQSLMRRLGGDESAEGLLKFLVAVRGELHHFSRKSSRPKGHPLNQKEFRPVAWFAMAICLGVLPKIITAGADPFASGPRAV